MKGDFTRDTFDSIRHFSRVLMQQGRVQLDADFNEQAAIQQHYLRTFAADISLSITMYIVHLGFKITPIPEEKNFFISGGHFYVAGILCEAGSTPIPIKQGDNGDQVKIPGWASENFEFQEGQYVEVFTTVAFYPYDSIVTKIKSVDSITLALNNEVSSLFSDPQLIPRIRRIPTYSTQPDYHPDLTTLTNGEHLVYLDVWERLITHIEDDSIREVALGGPDTAVRTKVVWQVKTVDTAIITDPNALKLSYWFLFQWLNDQFQLANRGRLRARAKQSLTSTDPCITSPDARYRRAENHLYRVEIHREGIAWDSITDHPPTTDNATFKWSRENGSVIFPIVSPVSSGNGTTTFILENLGRDDRLSLKENDWVEIQDDDSVLQNLAGNLLQVHSIDRTSMIVTLYGTTDPNVGRNLSKHPLLRRWDQQGKPHEGELPLESDGTIVIVEGKGEGKDESGWLSLEDGIQIQFQKPHAGEPPNEYRTGDYWLIPARAATGDVEWPTKKDGNEKLIRLSLPPHGVQHYYAPLAVIEVESTGAIKIISQQPDGGPTASGARVESIFGVGAGQTASPSEASGGG